MRGFIAITTILIILGVGLVVGLGISFLAAEDLAMSSETIQSGLAEYLANICAEEALMKLKENSGYSGNETLTIEDGICQILPISGNWTIETVGNFQNRIKKIRIVVSQISPEMQISSWQFIP